MDNELRPTSSPAAEKRKSRQLWDEKHPDRHLAHRAVGAAIASGRLKAQPCARCGATHPIHAHHEDYARPLDVIWLCPKHHRERHREMEGVALCAKPTKIVREIDPLLEPGRARQRERSKRFYLRHRNDPKYRTKWRLVGDFPEIDS